MSLFELWTSPPSEADQSVGLGSAGPFAAWRHRAARVELLDTADAAMEVKLNHREWEIFTIVPVETAGGVRWAPFGLADMMNTGGAIAATELRTKLKSRQASWQAAGAINVDYNVTDKANASICQSINQAALDWALANASPKALSRYEAVGQLYRIVLISGAGIR